MIRNLMLAVGLFTLTGASAIAAPAAPVTPNHHRVAKTEDPAPTDSSAKKAKKTKKPAKKAKDDKAPEGAKDPAPAK
jgi:hypothetical protein